jgi:hypothetical protein
MLIKMLEMPMAPGAGAGTTGKTIPVLYILFRASILKGNYLTITAYGSS